MPTPEDAAYRHFLGALADGATPTQAIDVGALAWSERSPLLDEVRARDEFRRFIAEKLGELLVEALKKEDSASAKPWVRQLTPR